MSDENSEKTAAETKSAKAEQLNTKAAGIVGIAVMCSRVLGLVREQLFAGLFGGGKLMDAFTVAFRTPNLLRDLFAEGALSTAFVTTFTKKFANEGEQSAWKLANKMATLTAIFMSAICIFGVLLAPVIVRLLAPGFFEIEGKGELTILLAQIMYPFVLLVSLGALVMGMLNARNVFGVPAMASSFFNLGSIIGGVAIGWWIDPGFGQRALVGLAFGTLIGGLLQLVVQFPALRKIGYRFRPDFLWKDEGVRTILRLMGPAVIAASSVQVNVMVNTFFASWLEDGTVFRLGIAFRLMQLPLGIFGVAIGTVTLPLLSRLAAKEQRGEFRAVLGKGMRLAFLLTVPATIGLMMLARPILSLLYEHGKMSAHAIDQAALGLQGYALGLCAYSALKILSPAFYAVDKRTLPMIVSFIAIGTNAIINGLFTFVFKWGIQGLAMGTGCVAVLNFVILYVLMGRELSGLETRKLMVALARIAGASAPLVAICWAANHWILKGWQEWGIIMQAVALLGVIGVAGLSFFATAFIVRVEEIGELMEAVRRKLRRRAAAAR